jgi:hypothetical protein
MAMAKGDDEMNQVPEPPPHLSRRSDGKKWLTAAIVLVFLICLIFALYVIIAGFYWKPVPNG